MIDAVSTSIPSSESKVGVHILAGMGTSATEKTEIIEISSIAKLVIRD